MEVNGHLHTMATFIREEKKQYPLNRRPDGPHSQSEILEKRKISCPYWDSQPGLSRRSLVTIPTSAITILTTAIKLCLNFHLPSYMKSVYINSQCRVQNITEILEILYTSEKKTVKAQLHQHLIPWLMFLLATDITWLLHASCCTLQKTIQILTFYFLFSL